MRGRLFAKAGVIAALALSLGACLGGGKAPSELLTLTPNNPPAAGATRSGGPGDGLAVLTPTVPQALSTTRIPVYVSPTVIQYLQDATWVEPPKDLFRRLLGQTISGRTGRLVLNPDLYTEVQGPTLTGQLLQFGYDPSQAAVVVTFEAALARGAQSVQTQRFESRVPVAQPVTAVVAPALNQAANDVAEQVADWIGR